MFATTMLIRDVYIGMALDFDPFDDEDVTPNREDNFELDTGRFRDPDSGEFEPGSPPPDLDEEVRLDSLEPEG